MIVRGAMPRTGLVCRNSHHPSIAARCRRRSLSTACTLRGTSKRPNQPQRHAYAIRGGFRKCFSNLISTRLAPGISADRLCPQLMHSVPSPLREQQYLVCPSRRPTRCRERRSSRVGGRSLRVMDAGFCRDSKLTSFSGWNSLAVGTIPPKLVHGPGLVVAVKPPVRGFPLPSAT